MAKVTYENLSDALSINNDLMRKYVYSVITNFSPTSTNVARILSHLTNTTIHVTPEDKDLWDSAYDRAKKYANELFEGKSTLDFKLVNELPSINISTNSIYLLETGVGDVYEQYIYVENEWRSLGSTAINMDNFYTKEQLDQIIKDLKSSSQHNHKNKEILDLVTAAFTVEEKKSLSKISSLDVDGLNSHISDKLKHLSEEERQNLDNIGSLDVESMSQHLANMTIHITPELSDKWNNMLSEAKKYTDENISELVVISQTDSLPENPNSHTIYCIPNSEPSNERMFLKYIYINGQWESFNGGGGESGNIDMSLYMTALEVKSYVAESNHTHANKDILDKTTESFTTGDKEMLNTIGSNIDSCINHIGDTNSHLSQSEKQTILNLDTTISAIVDNKIGDLGSAIKIIYADSLPTTLGEVNQNAIYFIRKTGIPSDLIPSEDISSALISVNYDKYIWSNDYGCWEIFGPDLSLTEDEIDEILNF